MVSRLSISGIALLEYSRFIILGVRSLDKQWLLSTRSKQNQQIITFTPCETMDTRVVFGDSDFIITVEMQSNAKQCMLE